MIAVHWKNNRVSNPSNNFYRESVATNSRIANERNYFSKCNLVAVVLHLETI